jgi:hypothetical protein
LAGARPATSGADKQRARLHHRIENLRTQHEWGDIDDASYRSGRADAEAQMAGMRDNVKLVMFDRKRDILLSMAENIEHATPAQLQELVAQLVERVETADRRVTRVDPSGEAVLRGRRGRHLRLGCVVVVPPRVSESRT